MRQWNSFQNFGDPVSGHDSTICEMIAANESALVGSCRFALMPLAMSSGKVLNPESVSTWSFVESNAVRLSANCVARKLGGGVIFIAGLVACPHNLQ